MSVQSISNIKADDSERLKVIEEIVRDKQINFGYSPLSDVAARMQANVWMGHLDDIPTERLWDVYKEAMRARDPKSLFSTTDMLQAWRRLRERESERARLNPPCKYCHDTGRMKFNKAGVGMVDIECPNH
jgi:hypothetical protein